MNQKEVLAFPSPSKRGGVCISNEYEGIWKEEEMKDEELAISFEKEKRKPLPFFLSLNAHKLGFVSKKVVKDSKEGLWFTRV